MDSKHKLSQGYTYWYGYLENTTQYDYETMPKVIGDFDTVEDFWGIYSYLQRAENLPGNVQFHVFLQGVKPMWEDERNKNGLAIKLTLKKGNTAPFWEELLLNFIGGMLATKAPINGVILSLKKNLDVISIWLADSTQAERTALDTYLKGMWKMTRKLAYREHPKWQGDQFVYPK